MHVSAINLLPSRKRFPDLVSVLEAATIAVAADRHSRSLYLVYGRGRIKPTEDGPQPLPGAAVIAFEVGGIDDLSFLLSAVVAAKGFHEFDHTSAV